MSNPQNVVLAVYAALPVGKRRVVKELLDYIEGYWGDLGDERTRAFWVRVLSAIDAPFGRALDAWWAWRWTRATPTPEELAKPERRPGWHRDCQIENAFRDFHSWFDDVPPDA